MQIDIVGNEQIQVAVAIIIEKSTSGSPAKISFVQQPRLTRNIRKRTVSVVSVEHILTVIRDEDVFETIVVIVTNSYPARPTRAQQAGLLRDIGKCAVSIVFVQAVAGFWNDLVHALTAEHENIQPAIVVIIEEGNTAAHSLNDVVLMLEAAVDDGRRKPSLCGNIGEVRKKRDTGGLASGHWLHIAGSDALTQSQRRRGRHP